MVYCFNIFCPFYAVWFAGMDRPVTKVLQTPVCNFCGRSLEISEIFALFCNVSLEVFEFSSLFVMYSMEVFEIFVLFYNVSL
jgi:hypothetical protein